jgi:hypothetical protein
LINKFSRFRLKIINLWVVGSILGRGKISLWQLSVTGHLSLTSDFEIMSGNNLAEKSVITGKLSRKVGLEYQPLRYDQKCDKISVQTLKEK